MVSPPARSLKVCFIGECNSGKSYIRSELQDIVHTYKVSDHVCVATYTKGNVVYNLWDFTGFEYDKKYILHSDIVIIFGKPITMSINSDRIRYIPDIKDVGPDTLLLLVNSILEDL